MSQSNYVMDYETILNCFVAVFEHYTEDKQEIFVIHELQDDFDKLLTFLQHNKKHKEWHISFNGLSFDSQITEYILREAAVLTPMSSEERANAIYKKAQSVIWRQGMGEWSEFPEKDLSIPQIDLFKLNHWDNPAKRSSLKWIQYSMHWDNIQEMPIHHSAFIRTRKELDMIIDYCINDVRSTKRIMHLSKGQINLRNNLSKQYNLYLRSASEPRISKELFLMFLSNKTGIKKYNLRQMRTHRGVIPVKDLILPYTKFESETFQDLLDNFKMVMIDANQTKGGFKYSIIYHGVKTDFGLGGVHGCNEPGVYTSDEEMIIMSSDVVSYYPNLAIKNKWSPAQIPKEAFCEQYEWFFEERKKIPKSDPTNYVYKIILNSTYGLSNDKNCYLYDPEFTMRITINGQLSLMMLYEMITERIPGAIPIMQNTDGVETKIPRAYKEKYLEICAEWEAITKLSLEHDEYSKLVLADVNNYIAVNMKGKYKCKGRFEFEDLALHKNKSFLIVPKALFNYFVNDIPPETYLMQNRYIFDYCGGVRSKGDWAFHETCVIDREVVKTPLQKTIRYYVSEKGCKIVKINKTDGREIQLEAGKWMQTDFSKFEKKRWEDYDVDESFYLRKIYQEISNITPKKHQLTLF